MLVDTENFDFGADEGIEVVSNIIDNRDMTDVTMTAIGYMNKNGKTLVCVKKGDRVLYGITPEELSDKLNFNWDMEIIKRPRILTVEAVDNAVLFTLMDEAEYFYTVKTIGNITNDVIDISKFDEPFVGDKKPNLSNSIISVDKFLDKDGNKLVVMIRRKDIMYGCKLYDIIDDGAEIEEQAIKKPLYKRVKEYYGIKV